MNTQRQKIQRANEIKLLRNAQLSNKYKEWVLKDFLSKPRKDKAQNKKRLLQRNRILKRIAYLDSFAISHTTKYQTNTHLKNKIQDARITIKRTSQRKANFVHIYDNLETNLYKELVKDKRRERHDKKQLKKQLTNKELQKELNRKNKLRTKAANIKKHIDSITPKGVQTFDFNYILHLVEVYNGYTPKVKSHLKNKLFNLIDD